MVVDKSLLESLMILWCNETTFEVRIEEPRPVFFLVAQGKESSSTNGRPGVLRAVTFCSRAPGTVVLIPR